MFRIDRCSKEAIASAQGALLFEPCKRIMHVKESMGQHSDSTSTEPPLGNNGRRKWCCKIGVYYVASSQVAERLGSLE